MKWIGLFFLIICYTVLLAGCTKNTEKSPPVESAVQMRLTPIKRRTQVKILLQEIVFWMMQVIS